MKVAITGATGFVGSRLVERLRSEGHQVLVFSRSLNKAEKVFPKSLIGRFAFDPEVLILAQKMGYKIKEIPVLWKNDLQSKVGLSNVFKMAMDILRIRINLLKGVYDKKAK